jgi:hypothetical protein
MCVGGLALGVLGGLGRGTRGKKRNLVIVATWLNQYLIWWQLGNLNHNISSVGNIMGKRISRVGN